MKRVIIHLMVAGLVTGVAGASVLLPVGACSGRCGINGPAPQSFRRGATLRPGVYILTTRQSHAASIRCLTISPLIM
jgi:hypothetical protein